MDPFPKAVEHLPCFIFASPLVALAVNTVAQVVLLRSSRGARYMRSMIGGFLTGAAALAAMDFILFLKLENALPSVAVHVLTYGALSYCYFHFVNLGQSSIRIRIYAEIAASPGGLSIHDLARDYNETALMALRLQRLAESGDIVERNGRFFIGRYRLAAVARIIFAAKRFLLSRTSEFL